MFVVGALWQTMSANAVPAIVLLAAMAYAGERDAVDFETIRTPIIFEGNATTAYRDPAAVYHEGMFHLFFTVVKTEADGKVYSYTACSRSPDLLRWTEPRTFTPRDQSLNYCSPGSIVRRVTWSPVP